MMPDALDRPARWLFGMLADASVRAVLLGIVTGTAFVVLRVRRPAVRLRVWTAALVAAMFMPVVGLVVPSLRVPAPWLRPSSAPIALPRVPSPSETVVRLEASVARDVTQPPSSQSFDIRVAPARNEIAAASTRAWTFSWAQTAAAVYVAGAIFLLLRVLVGWNAARRLLRRAAPIADADLMARLSRHAGTSDLPRLPCLLEAPASFVPMTVGLFNPVLLLPSSWLEWDATTRDAVLVHELAHIARRDAIAQRLALLYRAIYWFNPLAWWLHRHLVELAEHASDDAVLEAGVDRAGYAGILVDFFRAVGRETRRADWSVAMASGASVDRRVERILSWRRGSPIGKRLQFGLAIALIPVAIVAAAAEPVPVDPPVTRPVALSSTTAMPSATAQQLPYVGALRVTPATTTSTMATPIELTSTAPALPATTTNSQSVDRRGTLPADPIPNAMMVVLAFDLGTSRESRERSVEQARRLLAEAETRFSVGLAKGKVWRIETVGAAAEILQDFTGDMNKLEAALAKVATAASIQIGGAARLATVQRMCRDLSDLPLSDAYFQDWPHMWAAVKIGTFSPLTLDSSFRGIDYFLTGSSATAEEQRGFEAACQRPNLAYASITAATIIEVHPPSPQAPATYYMSPSPVQAQILTLVAGHLTALVFDASTPTGPDVARALDRANKFIDDAGPQESISIIATGITPRTLQPFTRDKALLRAALAKVNAGATDARTTATSVRSLCTTMPGGMTGVNLVELGFASPNQVGQRIVVMTSGDIRVIYLSTAVERGQLAARDLLDVASACGASRVAFYVFDGSWISRAYTPPAIAKPPDGMREIGYDVGIGVEHVSRQPDCPVTILQSKPEIDGFISAKIRNDSQKAVRLVTVGAVMTPNDDSLKVSRVFTAAGPSTALEPGTSFEMATRLFDGGSLFLLARQGALAELGIVEVQFTDGSKWSYDLKSKGRFER